MSGLRPDNKNRNAAAGKGVLPSRREIWLVNDGAAQRGIGTEQVIDQASSQGSRLFPRFGLKMRQPLTFLATIENDDPGMKALGIILILALLTISGAAYTDQLLTSDQQIAQAAN
jgi:hypothetical protein